MPSTLTNKYLVLMVAFAAVVIFDCDAATQCKEMDLSSKDYRYSRQTVNGAGLVTSMTLVKRYSKSSCTLGTSYGSYGTDVWVNLGCRGRFDVCFITGGSRQVTCSSTKYKVANCNAERQIQTLTLEKHLSSSPCVHGFSFWSSGTYVIATNGCRAVFNIGFYN